MFATILSALGLSKGIAYLILAGLLLAAGGGVYWYIYHQGSTAGAAKVEAQVQQNTITLQRKINRAEQAAPRTPRDVSNSLRDGSF